MIITSVKLKTYLLKKYLFPTEGLIGRQRVGEQVWSGPGSQCRSLLRNQYWFPWIRGERMARYTMELGGKSAAIVLDDMETDGAESHPKPLHAEWPGLLDRTRRSGAQTAQTCAVARSPCAGFPCVGPPCVGSLPVCPPWLAGECGSFRSGAIASPSRHA